MAGSYGQSPKHLDDGSIIFVYYYYVEGVPTWFIAYQPPSIPEDWSDWNLKVLDGDETVEESPDPRVSVPVDTISSDAISVVIDTDGFERREAITESAVSAYQDVEGDEHSPFSPDFSEMSDAELIAWAERDDSYMSFSDLKRVLKYADKGYIEKERLKLLLGEWLDDKG